LNYAIIAVDDGSTDNTASILSSLQNGFPIMLLKHPKNLGLQAALRTGFKKAVQIARNGDTIAVLDADLTHDPSYVPVMMKSVRASYDVVIGSRYVRGGRQLGVAPHRRILSRGISLFSKLLFRLSVKDVTSGFRCYKASIVRKIVNTYGPNFIESKGFEVAFELLVKAHKLGAKMSEVPIVLDYSKKKGRSKLKIQKTIFNYLRLMYRLRQ
jgi:dolichol-phosphate mannosyltransferase